MVAVAVVVAAVVLVAVFVKRGGTGVTGGVTPKATAPTGPVTRQSGIGNVTVPEVGAKDAPKDVAVPQNVAPGAPSGNTKLRIFGISVSGDKFTPNAVIVNFGDTVHINLTASDKDYDFFQPDYGLLAVLTKGQTKAAEFQATAAGKFTFYCRSCGGPAKGPVGYLVVVGQ